MANENVFDNFLFSVSSLALDALHIIIIFTGLSSSFSRRKITLSSFPLTMNDKVLQPQGIDRET